MTSNLSIQGVVAVLILQGLCGCVGLRPADGFDVRSMGAVGDGAPCAADDESALVPLALKLIGEVGCGMPESLFLALHTVSEHIKEINHG